MNKWVKEALRKYAVFSGRSRRKEYWNFVYVYWITSIVILFIDLQIGTIDAGTGIGLLGAIFSVAMLVPSLSVTIRRLHDTGRSGWWLFILFIPLLGAIVFFVLMLLDGQPGENQYGVNPKEV